MGHERNVIPTEHIKAHKRIATNLPNKGGVHFSHTILLDGNWCQATLAVAEAVADAGHC
jgi:hypothetical protein